MWNWKEISEHGLPRDLCPVLVKVLDRAENLVLQVVLTVDNGEFCTDASSSEIYGAEPLSPISDNFEPISWIELAD